MGDNIRTYLKEMGLSEYEVAVYMALLRTGTATAGTIASDADVPQPRVYDILERLETKGFVMVQQGRPQKFGPVEPRQAIRQFCEFTRRQHVSHVEEIQSLGDEFIREFDRSTWRDSYADVDINWSHPDRHRVLDQMEGLAADASSEVLLVTTPTSFERVVNHHVERLDDAASAGADIRAVVSSERDLKGPVQERAREVMRLRFVDEIHGRFYTYDGERILFTYRTPNTDGFVGVSMTSPHLYATLSTMFDMLWDSARPLVA
ncbi:hypothetical protein BRD06_07780 [Halobacteriales archaeon QS_9_67_15]|nr:MAG: hypothetical protein BRD06_07780 [Halobacteriales archaeon QS_9_67_15]